LYETILLLCFLLTYFHFRFKSHSLFIYHLGNRIAQHLLLSFSNLAGLLNDRGILWNEEMLILFVI
jgi:hypothetical protein